MHIPKHIDVLFKGIIITICLLAITSTVSIVKSLVRCNASVLHAPKDTDIPILSDITETTTDISVVTQSKTKFKFWLNTQKQTHVFDTSFVNIIIHDKPNIELKYILDVSNKTPEIRYPEIHLNRKQFDKLNKEYKTVSGHELTPQTQKSE